MHGTEESTSKAKEQDYRERVTMSAEQKALESAVTDPSLTDGPRSDDTVRTGGTLRDSPLRRLRRENHLLRLQLLKLREQQRNLLSQVAAAGLLCPRDAGTSSPLSPSGAPPPSSTAAIAYLPMEGLSPRSSSDSVDDEAATLRARMLQRREERHQRTTTARALLPGVEQLEANYAGGAPQPNHDSSVGALKETMLLRTSREQEHGTAGSDEMASAPNGSGAPPPPPVDPAKHERPLAEDDTSAEAMLQRFQNRKAKRRLRLEQMLGSAEDAVAETTPFGNAPSHLAGALAEGAASRVNSSNSSTATITGVGGTEDESVAGEALAASGGGAAVGHHTARVGESAASAGPTPVGPTQNPNQIGRVVSDAVRNNSWYLCKVLEAALLDTFQARPVNDSATPAQTPTHSTPGGIPTGGPDHVVEKGAGVGAAAPQLLYQVGISDNALRRAIEESLVLPFRCIQNAPQRLTSQQAAEEAVPPFEVENKDPELRRCFAGHGMRDSADRGTRAEPAGGAEADAEDENGSNNPSVLGADDDNLDPFARLLLARISAELPSGNAKGDKKHKESRSSGKHRGEYQQGLYPGVAEGGESFAMSFGKGAPSSSPTSSKPNAAFVMSAAGGDGKVHVPKKHFSRLDEVQVEMHAPVIFNQIRGFLRLDVDRFRRSFSQAATRADAAGGLSDGASTDGPRLSFSQQQQQQQRRARASGATGGTGEATAWRISVSPGKSGTTLLYFGDYVMKTVKPSEMEFFTRKFLPAYVRYCERNPHTLLPRFYGLVTVRWWKAGMAQHFVLMQNVFATPYYIHRIYDVKGSTVNRTALQPGKPPPRTAFGALLLKDNDLPAQLIICGAYQRAIMLAQFRSDVGFLRQLSIVDYSCMIGVRSRLFSREEGPSKTIVLQRHQHHSSDEPYVDPLGGGEALARHTRSHSEITNVTSAAAEAGDQTANVAIQGAGQPVPAQVSRPASEDDVYVCIHGCDGGLLSLPIFAPGDDTTAREDVYYLGIIDVLQTYNSAKKLESFAKGFVNDRQAISVIPPEGYSERLYKVLERITV